jgi:hypothetical protein
MKRYLAALLVVLGVVGLVGVLAGGAGYAEDNGDNGDNGDENASRAKCSEATLHGTYLFAYDGVVGKKQLPLAVAGYEVFDGNGKIRGVESVNFNGHIGRKSQTSGTYKVKADCTGTLTYDGGDPVRYDVFIAPDGSEFTFVLIKPKAQVTSEFEPRATAAKRVGP